MNFAGAVIFLVGDDGTARKVKLGQELASGGAGMVFSVEGVIGIVVKIYRPETLQSDGADYQKKLLWMLQHVPVLPAVGTFVQIAWPLALAKDSSGKFLGFAMPALDFGKTELLESMLQPKQAALKKIRSDLGARITVAANLATVVTAIHQQGHQIVDLKPPNLRFYKNELYVTVLDCDGFHVQVPGGSYAAPQATPEYLAPEYHANAISAPELQDRFALAVIIFRILNFGVHPYDGKATSKATPTDREGRIAHNLYPYGITKIQGVEPLPVSAHQVFPSDLRQLFDLAFGRNPAQRPTARAWSESLARYAARRNALLVPCSVGHLWFAGQPCGECRRDRKLSRTPSIRPVVAFDINRVWSEIQAVPAISPLDEVHPEFYVLTPVPVPRGFSIRRHLMRAQRLLVSAMAVLALWKLEVNPYLVCSLATVWFWFPFGRAGCRRETLARASAIKHARIEYDILLKSWKARGDEAILVETLKTLADKKAAYLSLQRDIQHQLGVAYQHAKDRRLYEFLAQEHLADYKIEGIGQILVEKLADYGIFTAAHISQDSIGCVPGFGQVRIDRLLEWKEALIDSFQLNPADVLSSADVAAIRQPFEARLKALERDLADGPALLKRCRADILSYRQQAKHAICLAAIAYEQARIDLRELVGE